MKNLCIILIVALLTLVSCNPSSQKDKAISSLTTNNSIEQTPLYKETSTETAVPKTTNLFITARSGLSLRKGTNLNSKKILTIPYGSQVTYLSSPEHTAMTVEGIIGDMIRVNYQGAAGFVFSGYLSTLSPPLEDETASQYAKRISTPDHVVKVSKIKNAKGDAYGLTTSIALPAKSWGEAYILAQGLFDIPKGISVDLTNNNKSTMVNIKKRLKTKIDEVNVGRDDNSNIINIVYSYALRDYNRTVTISKQDTNFLISEVEISR